MKEHETDLIVQLAKRFIEEMQDLEPAFGRAFFRFQAENRMHSSCASYTTASDVFIVNALMQDEFFDEMDELSVLLLSEMGKNPALILLTIDKDFDYEIQFEYENMNRWEISLADGGTAVPAD